MIKVSFVVPCYRSEQTIEKVVSEITSTITTLKSKVDNDPYDYEIVLVNDCSPDGTFDVISNLVATDKHIIGVNLAKNFGQHAALMAGYAQTTGDYVMSLDDDGQTPASEMGKLLEELESGQDVVYAKYSHKQHSGFRNFGSKVNERMTRVMLGKPKDLYVSSYFVARRFVVDEMLKYTNSYPYVIGLVLRTTKRITNVEVNHREREIGTSGYTLSKLLALWMNGFTAFSIKPLRIATLSGAIFAFLAFVYGIYTVVKKCVRPDVPMGFSAMICAIVFMGGMLMIMVGLAGEYIGRSYMALNESPQYVIREIKHNGIESPQS